MSSAAGSVTVQSLGVTMTPGSGGRLRLDWAGSTAELRAPARRISRVPVAWAWASGRTLREVPCPECGGARLKPASLAVTVGGRNIFELCNLSIAKAAVAPRLGP